MRFVYSVCLSSRTHSQCHVAQSTLSMFQVVRSVFHTNTESFESEALAPGAGDVERVVKATVCAGLELGINATLCDVTRPYVDVFTSVWTGLTLGCFHCLCIIV